MAVVLTIAGVTKSYRKGSLSIPSPVNGRGTASFDVRSNDGTYRPAMDAEVILTEGGTRRFGGLVNRLSERGTLGDQSGDYEAIYTRVSAVDFNQYGERRYVNGTIPAGTMKSQIEYVRANYLDDYGVTLDAGQADGPTLPELECRDRLVADVFKDISDLTGKYGDPYVGNIDYFKALKFAQPSATAAPFDIVEGNGSQVDDVTVEVSREQYANRVLLRVPSKSEAGRIESFTGDGTTGPFALQYTPTKLYGHILVASGGGETLGLVGESPIQWSYDSVTNSIAREAGATTIGETYNLYFDGTFTGAATAEDAGEIASYGIWEKVITVDAVPTDTTAQALADAALVKALQTPKTIKYRTFGLGLAPGQSQTITLPLRNLSESCVITDVTTKDYGKGDRLVRDVTATSGVNPQDSFHAVYKRWAGDKTGGSGATTSVGTGGPSSGGPAPPFTSVQFNNAGAFGGDPDFIYYKDQNSLVCGGGGSSITAADFESCQVFGYDNHIADPS